VTEAYTAYLKGRYHWNRRTDESLASAIECFNQAIAADPGYARAHAGLADVYATLAIYGRRPPRDVMPAAKGLAMRALTLAPDLAEAYVSLGLVQAIFDWTWADAERQFLKAIDIAPEMRRPSSVRELPRPSAVSGAARPIAPSRSIRVVTNHHLALAS
jgi:serine/threonine-protein kinase